MEWWVWMIIFWAVFGCGEGCRRRGLYGRGRIQRRRVRGELSSHAEMTPAHTHPPGLEPIRVRAPEGVPEARAPERAARETPVEKLQREFVEGAISVEEYERSLDRMNPRDLL